MKKHLYIVGQGIRGLSQLTLQGLEYLKSSQKILFLHTPEGAFEEIKRSYQLPLAESLSDLYVIGDVDQNNYTRIHDRVLAVLEQSGEVSLLVQGHPLFGVFVARLLKKSCDERKIEVTVAPGISSFDSMIVDQFRDPLEPGTVIIDANRMLLYSHPISTGLDYYIYHVSSVANSRTDLENPQARNQIDILSAYLLNFFPASHPIKLMSSSMSPMRASEGLEIKLESLSASSKHISAGTTIFIPGLRPSTVNREYLSLIRKSNV